MRKIWMVTIVLVGLSMVAGCGGGSGHDDFVDVYTEFIASMETYTADMEKAQDAGAVADAIDDYAKRMEAWAPDMKKIKDKYPEWQDKTKMPEDLQPLNEKAERMAQSMAGTFMKSMQYMNDPKVRAAHEHLQQAMMKLQ